MKFLTTLASHLNLIAPIVQAIQAYQAIGHSKETVVQKVGQIIEVTAALGEAVPIPLVDAVSATVESIAQQIFSPPPAATPAPAIPAAPATPAAV